MKRVYLSWFILFCWLPHVFSFGGPTDLGALTAAQGLSLQSAAMGADFGSVITMCDFNGDGKKDIIIGAPNANSGMGAVVIIFGGKDLSTVDVSDPAASGSGIILTCSGEANFGLKVACLGNVDFDPDTEEIFIGESSGIISWVVFGQASVTIDQDISVLQTFNIYAGSGTTMLDVVAVGDVNGDGLGDLVISAFDGANYHGVLLTDFLTAPLLDILTPQTNKVIFIANSAQSEPMTFAPAGDFNGDSINDIVVGNLKGSIVTDSAAVFPGADPNVNGYPLGILDIATFTPCIESMSNEMFFFEK